MNDTQRHRATKQQTPRRRGSRNWMPVTDDWIGTSDERLWQHTEGYDFDWHTTDPWTRRIAQ
jgi:hypothetical protein